jgi:Fe-S-cluster containining protein
MKTDKDRPSTWIKYRDGLCQSCWGTCCTMPVEVRAEDLERLGLATQDELLHSKKKLAKKLIKEKIVSSYREGTDLFMLSAKPNGDCYFLDSKTRLCTVYEKRPEVCRNFPIYQGPRLGLCPYRKK